MNSKSNQNQNQNIFLANVFMKQMPKYFVKNKRFFFNQTCVNN